MGKVANLTLIALHFVGTLWKLFENSSQKLREVQPANNQNTNFLLIHLGAFHSTKNSDVNFLKFPGANGTAFSNDCSRVENDKQHFCSLEMLDFEA